MDELVECGKCRRHVRRAEVRCPFCQASALSHGRGPVRSRAWNVGRVTRAVVFYGASTLGGCSEAAEEAPAPSPVVAPVVEPAATAVAVEEPEEEAPFPVPRIEPDTEAEADAERADAEDQKRRERTVRTVRVVRPPPPPPCCMPYGAPAFDFVV